MTLIVSIITREKVYLIGDKTQSIEGKNDQQVSTTLTTESGAKINIIANSIRVNAENFTKLNKVSKNCAIGGAGDLSKVTTYMEYIKDKSNIFDATRQYYTEHGTASPEQLLITGQENNIFFADVFVSNNVTDELTSFYYQRYTINKDKIGVVSIGSGSGIFLNMYARFKDDIIKKYKQSLNNENYAKWEIEFIEKVSEMYKDVAKYDAAVGNKIDIITI